MADILTYSTSVRIYQTLWCTPCWLASQHWFCLASQHWSCLASQQWSCLTSQHLSSCQNKLRIEEQHSDRVTSLRQDGYAVRLLTIEVGARYLVSNNSGAEIIWWGWRTPPTSHETSTMMKGSIRLCKIAYDSSLECSLIRVSKPNR